MQQSKTINQRAPGSNLVQEAPHVVISQEQFEQMQQQQNQIQSQLTDMRRHMPLAPFSFMVAGGVANVRLFPTKCYVTTLHNPDLVNTVTVVLADGGIYTKISTLLAAGAMLTNLWVPFENELILVSTAGSGNQSVLICGRNRR